METRRKILGQLGLGAAVAGLVVGGATAAESVASDSSGKPAAGDGGSGPWWLLAPHVRGDHLAGGWFLAHLGPVDRGASVLTLQHQDGQLARVHLCHHEGKPRGLAHTALLDMILMDGGQGDKPTDEPIGRVLMGLAAIISENELQTEGDLRALARMQPHGERVAAYGPETLT